MTWTVLPIDPRYELHPSGRLRRQKSQRERNLCVKQNGYLGGVFTFPGGERKPWGFDLHVLMALTFLGPRPEGCDVSHIDGNKLNNCISNLCYESRQKNVLRDIDKPRRRRSRLSKKEVAAIRRHPASHGKTAKHFKISKTQVWRIRQGLAWT